MGEHLAAMPVTNATVLCVGGITREEAENVRADGHEIDGFGYYLFLANEAEASRPIRVLAKFFSSFEAQSFARAIRGHAA